MKRENINAKYGFALRPAVSLIIFETKVYESSAKSWILFGINEFFFDPRLKIIRIATELIIINKLAFVKEISNVPILISGPILCTLNWVIGFDAIKLYLFLHIFCRPNYIGYSSNHTHKKKY